MANRICDIYVLENISNLGSHASSRSFSPLQFAGTEPLAAKLPFFRCFLQSASAMRVVRRIEITPAPVAMLFARLACTHKQNREA